MKIFRDYTFTWWQTSMLKFCAMFFGIAVGANFASVFLGYTTLLIVVSLVLGFYLAYVSFKS